MHPDRERRNRAGAAPGRIRRTNLAAEMPRRGSGAGKDSESGGERPGDLGAEALAGAGGAPRRCGAGKGIGEQHLTPWRRAGAARKRVEGAGGRGGRERRSRTCPLAEGAAPGGIPQTCPAADARGCRRRRPGSGDAADSESRSGDGWSVAFSRRRRVFVEKNMGKVGADRGFAQGLVRASGRGGYEAEFV